MGVVVVPELFANLPPHPNPQCIYPINLYELVPLLLNEYSSWTEEDIVDFIEEKTQRRIHSEDLISLRAVYHRHHNLEAEFLV